MPAKAFLFKTKSHTGFFSCTRCTVQGYNICLEEFVFLIQNVLEELMMIFLIKFNDNNCDDITETLDIPSLDIV